MRRTALLHLFVIALVLLAGCNTLGFGGDSSRSDSSTVTPAPVPTDEPTATPVPQLAPGLHRNDLDATALANAHNATLRNTSFTRKIVRTARFPNGTVFSQESIVYRAGNDGNLSYSVNQTDPRGGYEIPGDGAPPSQYEGWIGQKHGVIETTYANDTTTYTEIPPRNGTFGEIPPYVVGARTIQRLFAGTESRVVGTRSDNGTTLYEVDSTVLKTPMRRPPGVYYLDSEWEFTNVSQADQRAFVGPSGVVHEFRTRYELTNGNGTLDVASESRYTGIDTTVPERPPWYGKAINTSDGTTARPTESTTNPMRATAHPATV